MKIVIEVPEKSIDMAKAFLLSNCDTEEEEIEISKVCDQLKTAAEPITLDFDRMKGEYKSQLKQMYMALVMMAVGSIKMREMDMEDMTGIIGMA